jgi:hypothetical protein
MSDSILNAANNTNTLLGLVNQLTAQMNASFTPMVTTTINHKRNVYPITLPASIPTLRYFGIGLQGYFNINDSTLSQAYVPSEENMDLYLPVPFRVVPVAEDLDTETRALYRMRTRETIGGQDYFCYWLKCISFPDPTVLVTRVDTVSGDITPYVFDNANLNPVPDPDHSVEEIADATEKIVVSTGGVVELTGAELAEAINVLYGGDFRRARVSEFGYYTGEDQVVEALDHESNPFDMTEAIYAQLATHRCSLGVDLSDPASVLVDNVNYSNGSHYLI